MIDARCPECSELQSRITELEEERDRYYAALIGIEQESIKQQNDWKWQLRDKGLLTDFQIGVINGWIRASEIAKKALGGVGCQSRIHYSTSGQKT